MPIYKGEFERAAKSTSKMANEKSEFLANMNQE